MGQECFFLYEPKVMRLREALPFTHFASVPKELSCLPCVENQPQDLNQTKYQYEPNKITSLQDSADLCPLVKNTD